METKKTTQSYLGRGIHKPKLLLSLKEGSLKQMLNYIKTDKELDVQIRENYLNIYYKGGNILKVNSEKSVVFDHFYFYLGMPERSKKDFENDIEGVAKLKEETKNLLSKFRSQNFQAYFDDAKKVMEKWFIKNPKPERDQQHLLAVNNQYGKSDYTILDVEYMVSTKSDFKCYYNDKKPRFDIIAINKHGQLCVIELKKGIGALKGVSGLIEHWNCYNHSIGRNPAPFVKQMRLLLEQKQEFGLLDKELEIKSEIPIFMYAYAYNYKKSHEEQRQQFFQIFNSIDSPTPIPYLFLKEDNYKLCDNQ